MSELQLYYDAFRYRVAAGEFSDPDPDICECRGSGWFLSEVDTWHECPCHRGKPHPEDDMYEEYDENDCDHHVWAYMDRQCEMERRNRVVAEDDIPF